MNQLCPRYVFAGYQRFLDNNLIRSHHSFRLSLAEHRVIITIDQLHGRGLAGLHLVLADVVGFPLGLYPWRQVGVHPVQCALGPFLRFVYLLLPVLADVDVALHQLQKPTEALELGRSLDLGLYESLNLFVCEFTVVLLGEDLYIMDEFIALEEG